MDFALNDNAYMLQYLSEHGCKLIVFCSKKCDLKSERLLPSYEIIKNIIIYRIFDNFKEQSSLIPGKFKEILSLAKSFQPDVIFCSQQFNMSIAYKLRVYLKIPIVLLIEFAKDPINLVKKRWYLGLKFLAHPIATCYWRWLSTNAKVIITTNPEDIPYIPILQRSGTTMYYLPWCTHIPDEIQTYKSKKCMDRMIYVGSISKWKNSQEFLQTIPLILRKSPIREIFIIGPIIERGIIDPLLHQYSNIRYYQTLPRNDVLKLIKESFISYTPVIIGGWGFIGDSWGVKTPLLITHNHYNFNHGEDAMVIDDLPQIHNAVNTLLNDPILYQHLQETGWKRYSEQHSAESVGKKLFDILKTVVN